MSTLHLPGQTQFGVMHLPSCNAVPVGMSINAGGGAIHSVVTGGLTKRQELAARFLAAEIHLLTRGPLVDGESVSDELQGAIKRSLAIADALLQATELRLAEDESLVA